jgi:hypothetical protein
LIKKQFDIPRNGPESLNRNPLDEAMPSQSSYEKKIVELEVSEPLMPKIDAGQNVIVKPDVKKSCKQIKQKHTALGFQNKRVGRLISRKLRNRNKAHLSSIDLIEVNEVSDSEIEDFLALEDPDCQGFVPTEPYDFVTNLPPCLKGEEGFSSIGLGQGKITGKVDTTMFDCTLHRKVVPPIQCDVCFHWIERYYMTYPFFRLRLKHSQLKVNH